MIMFAAAAVVGSLVWVELATTTDLIRFQLDFARSGGWVAVATDEDGLPAGRCDGLIGRPEVVSSGGDADGTLTEIATAPGTLFRTGGATPGAIQLWADDNVSTLELSNGLAVGSNAAAELGLRTGMIVLPESSDPIPVAAVIDTQRRNPLASRQLISVLPPTGKIDQCWVEFSPGTLRAGMDFLGVFFADAESQLSVRPWIQLDEFARDPAAEFARRRAGSSMGTCGLPPWCACVVRSLVSEVRTRPIPGCRNCQKHALDDRTTRGVPHHLP